MFTKKHLKLFFLKVVNISKKEALMKKIFNKKVVLIIGLIIILLIGGFFISKILPFLGSKIGLTPTSFLPYQIERNESLNPTFEITGEVVKEDKNYTINSNINDSGLKLIKKGSVEINIEKGKLYESLNRIMLLANQFNGNVINSQIYKEDDKSSGYITLMIPSKDFDNFITKLNEYGEIKNITTTTTDVSQEYYDISGRLKILESQRELLLTWLKDAKEIKDMLSIRSELQNIETEIENIKGRMNYIDYHSNYSEISISLIEEVEKMPWWRKSELLNRLINGLLYALNGIINSILALIIFVAFILPWVLLVYLIYTFVLKYLKRKQNS